MQDIASRNIRLVNDIARYTDEVVSLDELKAKMDGGKKLIIKYGVDCTAPFLHLGHAVNLWVMRRFQEDGHKVIFLIGDFTSKIGDPTGKNSARKMLTDAEIESSATEFIRQVGRVLITDDSSVFEIRRNSEWYSNMPLNDFLELCSLVTHAKMISREMFRTRISTGTDIYINELLYPILQGYDSAMLKSDLTVVGSDQLFNEMMGRFFQDHFGQPKQVVMTTKITKGLWGDEKQSKSIGNFIALTDSSRDMYGKAMKLADDRIVDWMRVYTDIPLREIDAIESKMLSGQLNPMSAKELLAHELTAKYYGKEEADAEAKRFVEVFSRKKFPSDAPIVVVGQDILDIVSLVSACRTDLSKSKIRTLLKEGAVKLDDKKINDPHAQVRLSKERRLQVGRRSFYRICPEW